MRAMNSMLRLLLLILGPLVFACACRAEAASSPAPPKLHPCHVEGSAEAWLCGTFVVPEDRARPGGRTLPLEVAVLKSKTVHSREPVFFLAGGPGQDATHAAAGFADSPLRRDHDIVLMDTRGTGVATALDCPVADSQALQADLDPLFSDLSPYAPCAARLARKADLALYTTPIAMQDLDDLRRALGYHRIDLYGGSFGTRAGLVYLRMFGSHVRAAAFSGMVAFENPVPLYHTAAAERALERLFAECAGEAACHAAYPDPMGDLRAVLAKLAASPAHLTVKHPATGAAVAVILTPAGFANGVRVMLYSEEEGRAIPHLLSLAQAGDYAPFADAAVQAGYQFGHAVHIGVLLSVSCSEDVPRIRPTDIGPATAGSVFGDERVRGEIAACALWPKGRLPADYATPFASPVPTLILSGEIDPVTPPQWGEIARRTLPNSRHIVLPGAHVSEGPCVEQLVTQMFATADPGSVDAACVAKIAMPPFEVGGAKPL